MINERVMFMCGRVILDADQEGLYKKYGIERPEKIIINKKTEVFPTDMHPVIFYDDEKDIKMMKWGFTPGYAKRPIINARIETIDELVTFKESFKSRRCIIPVTGFYEWKDIDGKKIKYEIKLKLNEERIFSLAGIYSTYKVKGEDVEEFTIITTNANDQIKDIHNRMPVILDDKTENSWLSQIDTLEILKNEVLDCKLELEINEVVN
jgi:putative SOS response-associated peptidase YedK